ncbi:MAG: alpha/beta hydrolase [Parachlamydiaceae bacterium]
MKKDEPWKRTEEREPIVLENQGQKIFGVMHRPLTAEKCPAILMCHGLGGNKIGRGRLYVLLAQKLATLGIASLRIDFRGSGDSEGDFSAMTVDGEVSDALVALDFLKNDSQIDASRLAIFGRSFGGIVAILAAHQFASIKSLALWAPVFGSEQWQEKWQKAHSAQLDANQRNALMNIDGQQPGYPFFQQLFALKLDGPLKDLAHVPLLHIHGEKDLIVDLSHARKYKEVRHHASAKTTFKLLPHSDHDFSHLAERAEAFEETANWFLTTLKN